MPAKMAVGGPPASGRATRSEPDDLDRGRADGRDRQSFGAMLRAGWPRLARRPGRLFRKYAVLMVAVVGGALLVSGGLQVFFSYEKAKSSQLAIQHEKAITAATTIGHFIKQLQDQIGWTIQLAP